MLKTTRWRLLLDLVSTTALIVTCTVLTWDKLRPGGRQPQPVSAGGSPAPVEAVNLEMTVSAVTDGSKSAPQVLVEFGDFECPFCAVFARDTYPELKRDFIDAGRLQFVYRHYPLETIHKFALKASAALECAGGQQRYWEMHSRLFSEPQQLAETHLVRHARALGLDEADFTGCLATEPAEVIRRDQEEARKLGVRSTPTFFIGRLKESGKVAVEKRINGVVPYELLKSALAE